MKNWLGQSDLDNASRQEKLIDKIVPQIKELISSGKYPVGERLPSGRELAGRFKVSREVVREALKSLEQSGFVEIKIGSGAFVAENFHLPLFSAIQDLYHQGELTANHFCETRMTNECAAIREACAKATAEDIRRLRGLNRKMFDEMQHNGDVKEANRAFHLTITQISGNPLATLIVHSLLLMRSSLSVGKDEDDSTREFNETSYRQHEMMIEAIEARDVARCEMLMAMHTEIARGFRVLSDNRLKNPLI